MKSRIHFSIDRDLICAIMVGVLGGIIALAMFFLSGYMITQSALGAPLYALMILVVSVKLFGFLRAITRYIERLLSHKTTFTMLRNVRVQFLKMLYPVVPDIYRKFNSSDLITKMISRVEALQNIYLRVYYPPIVIGLTAIVSVITMLFLSPLHALVITLSMLLTLWIVPWLSAKKARKLKQQVTQTQKIFLKRYYDYKEGHEELKRFNRSDDFKNTVSHALRQFDDMQLKERRFLSIYDYLLNLIAMFSIFMCLVLGAQQIHDGQLNAIYITSIILMILTLFEQAVPMSNVAYYKADTDQALEEIHEVIVPKYKIPSERTNLKRSQNVLLEIKNVTFKYEHQYHSILKQINLTIEYGDKVAIIGPSGSGKSTLLQVLLGLYQIEEGKVMNSINDNEKYQKFNAMLQSQYIFDGTIRDNLFSEQSDDNLKKVLGDVGLEYLNLDRIVTLDGHNLSGGEAQRLSLARLLLRPSADFWILDEPTTALDINNTQKIINLIESLSQTLIIATHDLEILPRFNKIIVMNDGEIIENGSYQELMQHDGYLKKVIEMNRNEMKFFN